MNCSTSPTRERGSELNYMAFMQIPRLRVGLVFFRKRWAEDANAYNEVVTSWSGIESAAAKEPTATQRMLFEG